jgi:hypothetical protein
MLLYHGPTARHISVHEKPTQDYTKNPSKIRPLTIAMTSPTVRPILLEDDGGKVGVGAGVGTRTLTETVLLNAGCRVNLISTT